MSDKGHPITYSKPGASPLHPDEPVFVLRGKDVASTAMLAAYLRECELLGASGDHLAGVMGVLHNFRTWQERHPHLVRLPD